MAIFGGPLAYRWLRSRFPGGRGLPLTEEGTYLPGGGDKLPILFGESIFDDLRGRKILDFGCGDGGIAVELAKHGCEVVGLDIQQNLLECARYRATQAGVAVRFVTHVDESFDIVLSVDAFEHYDNPRQILRLMKERLVKGGSIITSFGPTWFHPYGGHLFSVFPWSHLLIKEATLLQWRADFKSDGARTFADVSGGLNKLSIGHWEGLVRQEGLRLATMECVPIRAARLFHNPLTREFLTAVVRARLEVT